MSQVRCPHHVVFCSQVCVTSYLFVCVRVCHDIRSFPLVNINLKLPASDTLCPIISLHHHTTIADTSATSSPCQNYLFNAMTITYMVTENATLISHQRLLFYLAATKQLSPSPQQVHFLLAYIISMISSFSVNCIASPP